MALITLLILGILLAAGTYLAYRKYPQWFKNLPFMKTTTTTSTTLTTSTSASTVTTSGAATTTTTVAPASTTASTTTTTTAFYGDLSNVYVAVPYSSGKGWFNFYTLTSGNYTLASYIVCPQLFNFTGGIFSYTSNSTTWYLDYSNGNLVFASSTPAMGKFTWNRSGVMTHVATGQTLQLGGNLDSNSIQLQLSGAAGTSTTSQTFSPEDTQLISTYVNVNGAYTSIPGPIYVATTGVNGSSKAWFNTYGGVSEGSKLSIYVPSPTVFYYQNKQFFYKNGSTTYYLVCNTTAPSTITFTAKTSTDTFTWTQKTGLIVHDQSGLNLEYVLPNGADNGFVVLHDPGRTGISNNASFNPEYAFSVV